MIRKVKYSIRDKLLALIIIIPTLSLVIFTGLGTKVFLDDKTAYVYNSAAENAQVLAGQIHSSFGLVNNLVGQIVSASQTPTAGFDEQAQRRFSEQKIIEHLLLYKKQGEKIHLLDSLVNHPREIERISPYDTDLLKSLPTKKGFETRLVDYPSRTRFFTFSQKLKTDGRADHFVVALVKLPDLYEAFSTSGIYSSYFVDNQNQIHIRPKFWRDSQKENEINDPTILAKAFINGSPQGVYEFNSSEKTLLVAFSETKVPGHYVFSVVDKELAFYVIKRFLLRAGLFLLAVLSLVLIVGIISSRSITSALTHLLARMRKIASGDFNVVHDIHSNDEIEELSANVKWMADEVKTLLDDKVEQARMVSELSMVTTVQKNLFPDLQARLGNISIECRYESASEAGGDWFHYSCFEDQIVVWIGDATGHGAPAALVTAAAKATSSVIEMQYRKQALKPSEIISTLNYAINQTAKRSVMMTFFVASIDTRTGLVTYSNASHEYPIIIPNIEGFKKTDCGILSESSGKRLGEDPEATYNDKTYQLKPGESLFFYTDGISDLENPEGKTFGDGKLLRSLVKVAQPNQSVSRVASLLASQFQDYRGTADLADDLMFVVCRYEPNSDIVRKAG